MMCMLTIMLAIVMMILRRIASSAKNKTVMNTTIVIMVMSEYGVCTIYGVCNICCRHSNLRCDDDAASCQREAAIKFADQNEDGPLDLILLTGRTSMGRNCNAFMDIMNLHKADELKDACLRDPHL